MLVRNAFIELDSITVGRRGFKYYVILVGNEELPSSGAGECAKYLIIIRKTFLFHSCAGGIADRARLQF